jgi:tetratricopeptide (TPR) repeat protein
MHTIRLLTMAVSVFKKCWSWFKAHGKHEHTTSCELMIPETIEEIITTTTTTTTTSTTTTTTTTETIIKEVFESTVSRFIVTSETIKICKSLVSYYMKVEQRSEAIEVAKRSLLLVWRLVICNGGAIALPRDFGSGAIEIALNLALCHHSSHHFHEAEKIYIRIYRACRSFCHIHDERLIKCSGVLINFCEEHRHRHKIIEVYQELLVQYRKNLGTNHTLTIRTLYVLGSLCADHGHDRASEYYEEIIATLNQESHVCHADALDAMFYMCRSHYEARHWHKLEGTRKVLWETWKGHHHAHARFTVELVEVLYHRYRYVLEIHDHCEDSILRELTFEYRKLCIETFGAAVAIAIKASVELAELYMRSEKYIHEAILIYEEVLSQTESTTTTTTTTTVISTTTIASVKKTLTKAYTSVCSHSSVSSAIVERAITVLVERYESLRITLGWSHTETLTWLRELAILRMKLKSQESQTVVERMLLEVTIEVINGERLSRTFHAAGRTLAEIYLSCGLVQQGLDMIEEIRLRIITGTAPTHGKSKIKLGKSVGKVVFVFLVTFEQVIRRQISGSYSEIMAGYLTESILYETYTRCIQSKAEIETILVNAGQLRAFLCSHSRNAQVERLEQQSLELFLKKRPIKTRNEIILIFHIGLLEEFGKHETRNVGIGGAACIASIAKVKHLLHQDRVQGAYGVALCSMGIINKQRAYYQLQNVPCGFKLSALMAGRDLDKPLKADIEPKLRENILELSRRIIHEVLQACKDSKLDFVRFKLRELNDLVGLLGEQQNFADLE